MSLDELARAGLLLPKEDWGKGDQHSKVNRAGLTATWVIAAVSAILMYLGNGHVLTWIGLGGMLVFIAWFTYLSIHAINLRYTAQLETFGPDQLSSNGDTTIVKGLSEVEE